jgi:hypothetical protein
VVSRQSRERPIQEQPDSPLLRLPGELRSRIYEFALTANGCLLYHFRVKKPCFVDVPSDRNDITPSQSLPEFNQLKYTCRQMYSETACLELKLNHIVFRSALDRAVDSMPAYRFGKFLDECTPSKQTWLKRVTLELCSRGSCQEEGFEPRTSYMRVAKFCSENPKTTVDYVIAHFRSVNARDPPRRRPSYFLQLFEFIAKGRFFLYFFRSIDLQVEVPVTLRLSQKFHLRYDHMQNAPGMNPLNVPNLRIRPNETELGKGYSESLYEAGRKHGLTEDAVRVCLEHAEDWVKNGI